jgi:hypothetical protein
VDAELAVHTTVVAGVGSYRSNRLGFADTEKDDLGRSRSEAFVNIYTRLFITLAVYQG